MRTIAVWNAKGGVAKTTTTLNLSAALARSGKRVLVMDVDAQCDLSASLCLEDTGGLYHAIAGEQDIMDIVTPTDVTNLEAIPGTKLILAVNNLATDYGALLKHIMGPLVSSGKWDYILVDCPSQFGIVNQAVLTEVDEVIIPVEAAGYGIRGLNNIIELLDIVREKRVTELTISGILAVKVDYRKRMGRSVVDLLREKYGDYVFQTVIRTNARVEELSVVNKTIFDHSPSSGGAKEYMSLAKEIVGQVA